MRSGSGWRLKFWSSDASDAVSGKSLEETVSQNKTKAKQPQPNEARTDAPAFAGWRVYFCALAAGSPIAVGPGVSVFVEDGAMP